MHKHLKTIAAISLSFLILGSLGACKKIEGTADECIREAQSLKGEETVHVVVTSYIAEDTIEPFDDGLTADDGLPDSYQSPEYIIRISDEDTPFFSEINEHAIPDRFIYCFFAKDDSEGLEYLRYGDKVTIEGTLNGNIMRDHLILSDCKLVG